jgi:hypothetical protein
MGEPARIKIDGRDYDRVEDMPSEVRGIYELAVRSVPGAKDRDGDGVPDLPVTTRIHTSVDTQIVVNGRTYRSLDEVPNEIRREIEHGMRGGAPGASFILPQQSDPSVGIRLVQSIEPGRTGVETMLRLVMVLAFVVVVAVVTWMVLGAR